jgi:hypothetical protein
MEQVDWKQWFDKTSKPYGEDSLVRMTLYEDLYQAFKARFIQETSSTKEKG